MMIELAISFLFLTKVLMKLKILLWTLNVQSTISASLMHWLRFIFLYATSVQNIETIDKIK